MRALGLDACRAGWMAVLFVDGRISGQRVFDTFVAAVTEMQPDQVAIDIPIGLVNEADRWARRRGPALFEGEQVVGL